MVIGILAALVLNTFSGIQARARDTERQTDINSIATQLEVYYNNNGGYPILTGQLDTNSWDTTNLKGIDPNALHAPGSSTNSMAATADATHYGYATYASDGTTACTTAPCAKFKLTWIKESDNNSTQTKSSLN